MFFEEGEPLIDGEPGDLKFVVRTRAHSRFQRAGHDLRYNLTISLLDALTGFSTEARMPVLQAFPASRFHAHVCCKHARLRSHPGLSLASMCCCRR